jgi:NitT/TauT family transport system substrate-binding protein
VQLYVRGIGAFVTALVCAMFIMAVPVRADTIRIQALPTDAGAEAFYALDLGFFRDAGLDVVVQSSANGSAMISAVMSGAVDVGYANLFSQAQAHLRGLPIKLLFPASMYDGSHPATVLAVALDSTIHSVRDLVGKTVAVNGIGTLIQYAPVIELDRMGLSGESVHFVEMPSSSAYPAIINHKIDAVELSEPFVSASAGQVRILAPGLDGIARRFVSGGFFSSAAWVGAHPAEVVKLQSVFARTAKWANTHHRESAAILAKYAKLDPDAVLRMTRTPYGERIDLPLMQTEIDVTAEYHFLDRSFPIQEMLVDQKR